ncbi:hypothetical protein GGTG_04023 [Gaeumannomyces tritici R3-111a-1]|uniref:Uncharacterized protein n=1 Tax=Gaeumannomyces tritici (strain R3-111a-1) TaxID=644352 RepID=J3NRX5_GAET3|nr:hypothetical protein GGTG_04023 [Gaeumannomyces tritici R3-111a-1]EJT78931.1 hypothetical protein GGTG_04023 [Gaeumannomyces tritici R3-111a-1]
MVGLTGLAFRLKLPVNYRIYNVFPANLLRAFKKRPGKKPKNKKPKIEGKKKDRFKVGKPPNGTADGLKRLNNGKCMLAVFKFIGGRKKSILKLFIGALKFSW